MSTVPAGAHCGVSVVIPTVGRPSLAVLLDVLAAAQRGRRPTEVLVVDDRRGGGLALPVPAGLAGITRVLSGRGAGPAAARNVGWRAARHPWVAFLDDDVRPDPDWFRRLDADLDVADGVGGVQGRVRVPLPARRAPTDWERCTHGLVAARWITADMAYRRVALAAVGGFDERFPRAYREDTELAYRVAAAGWRLAAGRRRVTHPVRPEGRWISLRAQRGNADDALLRRLYGPRWRSMLDVPAGRRRIHAATAAAGLTALSGCLVAALSTGSVRAVARSVALAAGGAAALATAEFAGGRIAPGPRTADEVGVMLVTSVLIPPLATAHWLRGWWRFRAARPWSAGTCVDAASRPDMVPSRPWPAPMGPVPAGDRDGKIFIGR